MVSTMMKRRKHALTWASTKLNIVPLKKVVRLFTCLHVDGFACLYGLLLAGWLHEYLINLAGHAKIGVG